MDTFPNTFEYQLEEIFPETEAIAIDGPVASGKGTVAGMVAEMLGFLDIDTGAMYRSIALLSVENNIETDDEEALTQLAVSAVLDQRPANDEQKEAGHRWRFFIGEEDVTSQIRSPEIDRRVPLVSRHIKVREELIRKQQEIARTRDVVMEGRDITHKVLPNAQVKIYLDADVEVRANRRHSQRLGKGYPSNYAEVLADLKMRDEIDRQRNLRIEPDAWHIISDNLTSEQIALMIVNKLFENREVRFLQAEAAGMSL